MSNIKAEYSLSIVYGPKMTNCRYCRPTSRPWLPNVANCYVCHCYYKGKTQVAHGHARYATENDEFKGKRIDADYICVRSAYCNPSCYCYEEAQK